MAYALGTFSAGSAPFPAVVNNGRVLPLADLLAGAPGSLGDVFADWTRWGAAIDAAMARAPAVGWHDEAALTACLPFMPENLYGAGANYRKHVIELIVDSGAGGVAHLSREERLAHGIKEMDARAASGKPFVWVGLRSSIAGPDRPLTLPDGMTEPDWEFELAVVMGRPARRVTAEYALDHIAGYTMANDCTARELVTRTDLKNLGMDWMACKGTPGFKVIGPYVTPAKFVPDPQSMHIRLSLNGKVMQDEGTADMIFSVARLVEFVSAHCQLEAGDIIMTGSPSGNGTHYSRFLRDGDEMIGEIEGLVGRQVVRCIAERRETAKAA